MKLTKPLHFLNAKGDFRSKKFQNKFKHNIILSNQIWTRHTSKILIGAVFSPEVDFPKAKCT